MYCGEISKLMISTKTFKNILTLSVICCVLFICPRSLAKSSSTETLPSLEKQKGTVYYKPSYFRRWWNIDWHIGFQEGVGQVEVNGKWGFINSAGKFAIEPIFDQVVEFHEGLAAVRTGAIINKPKAALFGLVGHWKYIDQTGHVVIDREGNSFSEGLATVLVPGKWNVSLLGFSKEHGRYGVINKDGRMVVPAKYRVIKPFSEGLAVFCEKDPIDPNAKYGYLNACGEVAIEPVYDGAVAFSEGLALVRFSGKLAFINRAGEIVTSLPYEGAHPFSEGLAAVKKNNKWGYIDKSGRVVIPFKFPAVKSFSEGYAAVIEEGKIGYINKNGEYVIKPRFPYFSRWKTPFGRHYNPFFSSFSEGLAPVMTENLKWGYINKKGEFVIKPKFDLAGQFTESFAKVAVGDKLGYINKQGEYIWEPTR